MKKRIEKKIYKRAHLKLVLYRRKEDTRSFYEIAKKDGILSSKEKAVFLAVEERLIRMAQEIIDEIRQEEKSWDSVLKSTSDTMSETKKG